MKIELIKKDVTFKQESTNFVISINDKIVKVNRVVFYDPKFTDYSVDLEWNQEDMKQLNDDEIDALNDYVEELQ